MYEVFSHCPGPGLNPLAAFTMCSSDPATESAAHAPMAATMIQISVRWPRGGLCALRGRAGGRGVREGVQGRALGWGRAGSTICNGLQRACGAACAAGGRSLHIHKAGEVDGQGVEREGAHQACVRRRGQAGGPWQAC